LPVPHKIHDEFNFPAPVQCHDGAGFRACQVLIGYTGKFLAKNPTLFYKSRFQGMIPFGVTREKKGITLFSLTCPGLDQVETALVAD
jgi:hypothetical protein